MRSKASGCLGGICDLGVGTHDSVIYSRQENASSTENSKKWDRTIYEERAAVADAEIEETKVPRQGCVPRESETVKEHRSDTMQCPLFA